jgi:hypothetical protein
MASTRVGHAASSSGPSVGHKKKQIQVSEFKTETVIQLTSIDKRTLMLQNSQTSWN